MDEYLRQLMESIKAELERGGIPVSNQIDPQPRINTRAKRRLGCCIAHNGTYSIEVSASILQDELLLRKTLAHELLHTCPGCCNHGPRWKSYAERAGRLLGYSISRTVPVEGTEEPLRQEKVQYILQCQSCGAEIPRMRLSKAVKTPWKYRCKCGGKLKRIR